MALIPSFVQNEIQPVRDAVLMSAFNFFESGDALLPPHDAVISELDMRHLWGIYVGLLSAIVPNAEGIEYSLSEARMHYSLSDGKMHYSAGSSRMHYSIGDEDK